MMTTYDLLLILKLQIADKDTKANHPDEEKALPDSGSAFQIIP
jgi:hypothetical protein